MLITTISAKLALRINLQFSCHSAVRSTQIEIVSCHWLDSTSSWRQLPLSMLYLRLQIAVRLHSHNPCKNSSLSPPGMFITTMFLIPNIWNYNKCTNSNSIIGVHSNLLSIFMGQFQCILKINLRVIKLRYTYRASCGQN